MNETLQILMAALVSFTLVVYGLVVLIRALYIASQPDQWLLRVRNGRLVNAGIGIALWRRPGDVIVRFTSTLQRVRFTVEALSSDRMHTTIEGFILWSVDSRGDAPFKAYRMMGLINLADQSADMRGRKHLLTTPQHRAFRRLLTAEVQRCAATMTLDDLLLHQDALLEGVARRLDPLSESLGICIDQVEIVQARPSDQSVMKDLAVAPLEAIREDAVRVRLESAGRTRQRQIESETRLSLEDARARRDREVAAATAALEISQKKAALLDLEHAAVRQRLEHDRDRQLIELTISREVRLREAAINAELALTHEHTAAELAEARHLREASALNAHTESIRAKAQAERDAALFIAEANEAKSPAVREYELQHQLVDRLSNALSELPIQDARWITVGDDSPLTSLAGLITGLKEAVSTSSIPAD